MPMMNPLTWTLLALVVVAAVALWWRIRRDRRRPAPVAPPPDAPVTAEQRALAEALLDKALAEAYEQNPKWTFGSFQWRPVENEVMLSPRGCGRLPTISLDTVPLAALAQAVHRRFYLRRDEVQHQRDLREVQIWLDHVESRLHHELYHHTDASKAPVVHPEANRDDLALTVEVAGTLTVVLDPAPDVPLATILEVARQFCANAPIDACGTRSGPTSLTRTVVAALPGLVEQHQAAKK
jgi:hypothetical protein